MAADTRRCTVQLPQVRAWVGKGLRPGLGTGWPCTLPHLPDVTIAMSPGGLDRPAIGGSLSDPTERLSSP